MPDSTENKCLTCGVPTSNPKYCSRSCAAKSNNRKSPKRQPEGECETCGAAISTRYDLCDACKRQAEQLADEETRNVKTFADPAGSTAKEAVQRVYVSQVTIFESSGQGQMRPPFEHAHPCGNLLNFLVGLVFAKPAYIRKEDVARIAALLRAFREFEVEVWDRREQVRDKVANLPIRCLDQALDRWVNHLFEDQHHPMMPVYALGLGEFIEPHVYDTHSRQWSDDPWRIVPVVEPDHERSVHGRDQLGSLHDPRAKKEFTQQIKRLQVVVRVPDGAEVHDWQHETPVLSAGDRFRFEIMRCHLTESGYYDRDDLQIKEMSPPRFDIADNFNIRGGIVQEPDDDGNDIGFGKVQHRLEMVVPIRWITHAVAWEQWPNVKKLLPVPEWGHEDDSRPH